MRQSTVMTDALLYRMCHPFINERVSHNHQKTEEHEHIHQKDYFWDIREAGLKQKLKIEYARY